MTQKEFEEYIKDDFEEYRQEFSIYQASPILSTYQAYIKITDKENSELKAVYEAFGCRVQSFLSWVTTENYPNYYKTNNLDKAAEYICIYMVSDRDYAGYGNIYRAIKELAPYLEDCWFFISEADSKWVDEYKIIDGNMLFQRAERKTTNEEYDECEAIALYFEREALDRNDINLRKLAAKEMTNNAEHTYKYSQDT